MSDLFDVELCVMSSADPSSAAATAHRALRGARLRAGLVELSPPLSSAGILALRLVPTTALPSGDSDTEGASPPTATSPLGSISSYFVYALAGAGAEEGSSMADVAHEGEEAVDAAAPYTSWRLPSRTFEGLWEASKRHRG